jgi:hypothetical protein
MQKFSRSRSIDPKQEALRQVKDKWNSETSEFIGDLIDFKRALNGKEVPSRGIPKTKLKDPMPQEVEALLSELSGNALSVIQHAKTVLDEQDRYSQIRNKSKISSKEEEIIKLAELISESSIFGKSWSGGRLWAKVKLLLSDDKKFSADILDGCHELIQNLKNLEDLCLSGDDQSSPKIFTAIQVCAHIFNNRILLNINKQLILQEESAKEIAQNLSAAKPSKAEKAEEDHSVDTDAEEDSDIEEEKVPGLKGHRTKSSPLEEIIAKEDLLIDILYKDEPLIKPVNEAFHEYWKNFPKKHILDEKNIAFRNACKKAEELQERYFKYKQGDKEVHFSEDDVETIDKLVLALAKLVDFYKSKIYDAAELSISNKPIFSLEQINARLGDKLEKDGPKSDTQDDNALMISEAGSVADIKNFIRKKWLNLKLDFGSSNSIEKYLKEILDASKSARNYIEKIMILIEDDSVNLNMKNIKNMFFNGQLKSNLPISKIIREVAPSYEFMMNLLKVSIVYADLYKQNIRREKFKETRYYYSISASDLKEHKLLMEQMAALYTTISAHLDQ